MRCAENVGALSNLGDFLAPVREDVLRFVMDRPKHGAVKGRY